MIDVVDKDGKRQVLDAVAPVFRLWTPDSAVLEDGRAGNERFYVSHWASCYAGAVQKRIQDGVAIPESWELLVAELQEAAGDADPFMRDVESAGRIQAVLEEYFGERPPGSYPTSTRDRSSRSSSSRRGARAAETGQRSLLESET